MQDVRVCAIESEDNTYSISCVFLSGSEARGCVYTLVGVADRMGGVNGTIEMGDSEEVRVELRPSSQVLAYDWERDGSFGTLPVTRNISSDIEACSTVSTTVTTTSPSPSPDNLPLPAIIAAVVAVMLLLALALVLLFLGIVLYKKGNHIIITIGGNLASSVTSDQSTLANRVYTSSGLLLHGVL